MTTEQRLENVERELARAKRGIRWLLAGLALLVLVLGALGAATSAQPVGAGGIVRAKQFILEDEEGEERALLAVVKGEPGLALLNANGECRAFLGVVTGEPSLNLYDANGKGRAALAPRGLSLFAVNGKLTWEAP